MTFLPIVFDNPIFLRELRRRMRGKAMIFFLIAYVGIVCAVSFLILLVQSATLDPSKGLNYIQQISQIGTAVFYSVLTVQALLALLVAPSITAGMITAERERQTFDFLRVTTIRPATFVAGGLLSTMMYVLLAQVCALPVLCVPFLYGGMSPGEVLGWFGTLLGASLVLCSAGMCLSSVKERTRAAQGGMLAITLACLFGLFFALPTLRFMAGVGGYWAPLWRNHALFQGALTVPGWAMFVAGGVYVSALLTLIACRKLYEPEKRALNYTQYLAASGAIVGAVMGMWWGGVKLGDMTLWFFLGGVLLFLAALIFCTGQMTVGDDLWRLKRAVPLLRRTDEAVLYLLLLVGLWALATWAFANSGAGGGASATDTGGILTAIANTAAPMIFLGMAARLLSVGAKAHGAALRLTLALGVGLLLVIPLLLLIAAHAGKGPADSTLLALTGISPFFSIPRLLEEVEASGAGANLLECLLLPGSVATALYMGLAAVALTLYWRIYRRRLKTTDFHYEFPA